MRCILGVATLTLVAALPHSAAAFCGFYVAGGDQKMFNDTTQVVLMRLGKRTVLTMQNTYKGPPDAFAIVMPVPVVLHEGDVKTVTKDVFAHVDRMGAPRLVDYWEQDPCDVGGYGHYVKGFAATFLIHGSRHRETIKGLGVTIEAKFTVGEYGEYQVLILSAMDSAGLETWLLQQKYHIPDGIEPLLRSYIESGSKFFVAKVDPAKVVFDSDGRAVLSPLRFHYDSEEFSLPIRLGLANSSGTQDLIVNILAPDQRYEVANYKNVTIPTNIDVDEAVRGKFPAFYAALFDRTIEKNRGAVVTEYAWQATTCDPCPGPTLKQDDLAKLGADVLTGPWAKPTAYIGYDFVLTRLHARYGKTISDDLRFREAAPIVGGLEFVQNGQGGLSEEAQPSSQNNFQGRYAIRHAWAGSLRCEDPMHKNWGGGSDLMPQPQLAYIESAVGPAFAPCGEIHLAQMVRQDIPALGIIADSAAPRDRPRTKSGCGCATSDPRDALEDAVMLGVGLVVARRRRPTCSNRPPGDRDE